MWQSWVELNIIPLRILFALLRSKRSSMKLPLRVGSYALGKLMNTYHVYTVRMNSALNESSALEHFECGNTIEIRNGIMFRFLPEATTHALCDHVVTSYC